MNELNINKLKEFNEALANLSDDVKDWQVSMHSILPPTCNTPGCFAGLISIVAKDLPELKAYYKPFNDINSYSYGYWSQALARFLGFDNRCDLTMWAKENPALWGCPRGGFMFSSEEAFVVDNSDWKNINLNHRDLINWWAQVEKNITEQEVNKCVIK